MLLGNVGQAQIPVLVDLPFVVSFWGTTSWVRASELLSCNNFTVSTVPIPLKPIWSRSVNLLFHHIHFSTPKKSHRPQSHGALVAQVLSGWPLQEIPQRARAPVPIRHKARLAACSCLTRTRWSWNAPFTDFTENRCGESKNRSCPKQLLRYYDSTILYV